MNADGYNFLAYCDECKEMGSVSCSRNELRQGNPVTVCAIVCTHTWTLSTEDTKKIRDEVAAFA